MNRLKVRLAVVVTAALLCVAGLFTVPTPASAAQGDSGLVLAQTEIYKCAWIACAFVGLTTIDHRIPLWCWVDSPYPPYGRWFYIYTVGYVQAGRVEDQPSLPKCSTWAALGS